jgi:hypothetical protein
MTEEAVFGIDVSSLDADRIANRFIRQDWQEIEIALMGGKWFDYRWMNPVAATYLFAHHYKKSYRTAFAQNIDFVRAAYVVPLPDDLFDIPDKLTKEKQAARRAQISGIWRARQVADAMGMPYDIYLDRAFHWRLRYWNRSSLPRPVHLYADLITDKAAIDWTEFQKERFYYSKLQNYTNQRYRGYAAQDAHHEYLFEQIAARGNKPALIANFIEEDLLPPEKIERRLGQEVFARAAALAVKTPEQLRYN